MVGGEGSEMGIFRIYRSKRFLNFLVVALLFCCGSVAAQEYIIKPKDVSIWRDGQDLSGFIDPSLRITGEQKGLNLIKVDLSDENQIDDPITELIEFFDAEYAVENVPMHAYIEPDDPLVSQQWSLDVVNARDAWGLSLGSHQVVVAVIDTGIQADHEDLFNNLWVNPNEYPNNNVDDDNNGYVDDFNGWDFHGKDNDPNDETADRNPGHGTHCSGIVGARCDNAVGVCGISPVVSIMPLRFLGSDGSGDLFAAIEAIGYAIDNGAHIISASWGAAIDEANAKPLVDAIKNAEAHGLIFVAAAGNDGRSNDSNSTYPANAQTPNMISVAASDSSDHKPQWSNYGRKVDIAAPGDSILSTIPDNDYLRLSGTSMATPMVSGIAALMKSLDIDLSGAVIKAILQSTGDEVNIETASNRRVRADRALEAVAQRKLTIVPAAITLSPDEKYDLSAWGGVAPYHFRSLDESIASVDDSGHLTALKEGDVTVEVSDSLGDTASSVSFKVIKGEPPGGSSCPIADQMLCMIMCIIQPQLPWCEGNGLPFPMPELPVQ